MDWIQYGEVIPSKEDEIAYLEAVKDLENGETLTIDFDKVKNFEDFESLLNLNTCILSK
ncbi:MAG: hypothetical protein LBQ59_03985 [Candidatus Peribacteria bacterium]|jgi:hypothetical protein|nr:hypothetical protein [Candidatus Peribacteria bacterium]